MHCTGYCHPCVYFYYKGKNNNYNDTTGETGKLQYDREGENHDREGKTMTERGKP